MERISATDNTVYAARRHYAAVALIDRLKAALEVFGPEDRRLTASQLSTVDQFHTRGLEATVELARLASLAPGMSVLDAGCGIGGPARLIAEVFGCAVTGFDLSEAFVDAARYLTERTGQTDHVTFRTGNVLDLPVARGEFDAVILQHVAMNIANRSRLYREMHRVLRSRGRLAIFDVVSINGSPAYPLPWSSAAEGSCLMTAETTREAIKAAGFRVVLFRDDTQAAKLWASRFQSSGPPPAPNLGTVMGPDFGEPTTNLVRGLLQGTLGTLTAVFEAD